MRDLGVKFVRLRFENGEGIDLAKKDLLLVDLGDVRSVIFGWDKINELKWLKDTTLIIKESANEDLIGLSFDYMNKGTEKEDKRTLLKRLSERDNIINLELHGEEGLIGNYFVNWSNESVNVNEDIVYKFNDTGDLLLTINKERKVRDDYLELFRNKEYMKLM